MYRCPHSLSLVPLGHSSALQQLLDGRQKLEIEYLLRQLLWRTNVSNKRALMNDLAKTIWNCLSRRIQGRLGDMRYKNVDEMLNTREGQAVLAFPNEMYYAGMVPLV